MTDPDKLHFESLKSCKALQGEGIVKGENPREIGVQNMSESLCCCSCECIVKSLKHSMCRWLTFKISCIPIFFFSSITI